MFQSTFLLSACENSRQLQRAFTSEHLLFELEVQKRKQLLMLPEEMPPGLWGSPYILHGFQIQKASRGEFCQRKTSLSLWSSVILAPWMSVSYQPLRRNSACHNSSFTVHQCQHCDIWQNRMHYPTAIKFSSWGKSLYFTSEECNPS